MMKGQFSENPRRQRHIIKKLKKSILSILDDQTTQNTIQSNNQQGNTTLSSIRMPLLLRQQKQNTYNSTLNDLTSGGSPFSKLSGDRNLSIPLKKPPLFARKQLKKERKKLCEFNLLNTNNDIHRESIRTDSSHLAKKKKIKMRRKQKDSQSLSVALVSKNFLFRIQPTSTKSNITSSKSSKPFNCSKHTRGHSHTFKKSTIDQSEGRMEDIMLTPKKKESKENDIYSIIRRIHSENRTEKEKDNKSLFKKLKSDIKQTELKMKNLLDNLQRTRLSNDEDLKRKIFVKKVGSFNNEFTRHGSI